MRKIIFICLVLLFFSAMSASGEYYQYKDAQGNLRFTDDTASIPENERTDVTVCESVKSDSVPLSSEESLLPVSRPKAENGVAANDTSESINAMRADLDQKADSLNKRKKELEVQAPNEDATPLEKKAYFEKINALNAEINDYKKQRQAYNAKVRTFNAQVEFKEKNAQAKPGE